MLKIAYVGAHSPNYLAKEHNILSDSISGLKQLSNDLNFELIAIDSPIATKENAKSVADSLEDADVDFALLQSASFATSDLVLEFANRNFRLGLWATEEPTKDGTIPLNSLMSVNIQAGVLTRYLKKQNIPFKWFYGSTKHKWFKPRLEITLRALEGIKQLRHSKIGLIGNSASHSYNLSFDQREFLTHWGTEVQTHDISKLFEIAQSANSYDVATAIEDISKAGKVEIPDRDLKVNALMYIGLKEFVTENNYDAIAISDWQIFEDELNIHPALACAWLAEHDGIAVASDKDVLGAASMLLMNTVSQDKSMLLSISDIDETRDAMLMWNCGNNPLNFANDKGVRWINYNADTTPIGGIADFTLLPQNTTLFRLSDDSRQLFVADSAVIDSPHQGFDGSRGWLTRFYMAGESVNLADMVNTILVEGLEHNLVLAKGHHADTIEEVAAWLGLTIIKQQSYQNYLQRPALI